MKKEIVIANGPFVLYLTARAIDQNLINPASLQLLYITSHKLSRSDIASILPKNIDFQQFNSKLIDQIRLLICVKNIYKYQRRHGCSLQIYIANICSVACNYLAFSRDKNFSNGENSLNLIAEGLANFYGPTQIEVLSSKNIFLKKLLSRIFGFTYRIIDGPISGISHIDYKKFITVEGYPFLNIKTYLVGPKKNKISRTNNILVLDGDADDFIDIRTLQSTLIDVVAGLSCENKLFYKIHPSVPRNVIVDVKTRQCLQANFCDDFTDVKSKLPIEFLIDSLQIHTIISFFSSALVNVKLLYPEINCICIGSENIKNQKDVAKFKSLFATFDIIVI